MVVFSVFGDDETTKPEKKVDEHKLHAKAVVSMYFVFVWVVSFHPKNTKQNLGPIGVTVYSQGTPRALPGPFLHKLLVKNTTI